jgi:hypothetical protein
MKTEEEKIEFRKHIAHHEEEEAENKKRGVLWIESKKDHDCDFDPNAKNGLAGCRMKDAPTH